MTTGCAHPETAWPAVFVEMMFSMCKGSAWEVTVLLEGNAQGLAFRQPMTGGCMMGAMRRERNGSTSTRRYVTYAGFLRKAQVESHLVCKPEAQGASRRARRTMFEAALRTVGVCHEGQMGRCWDSEDRRRGIRSLAEAVELRG